MIIRPFEQWLFEDVQKEFGIKRIKKLPALEQWLRIVDAKLPNALEDKYIFCHFEKILYLKTLVNQTLRKTRFLPMTDFVNH